MNDFDDHNLPPELGDVAKQLRESRYEASALELDKAKQRILGRTAPTKPAGRLGWLRAPTFVTAAIVALSVGGGSAAAFGINLGPVFRLVTPHVAHHRIVATASPSTTGGPATAAASADPPASAAALQYGNPFEQFIQALLAAIRNLFGGGGGGGGGGGLGGLGGLVSGILAAIAQLLASLGL
jgi:hypothetical protein